MSLAVRRRTPCYGRKGFRGPNFNLLYQPIFKMCDIVGLKPSYGSLETNRYGFAFSQDDGLAVTQMDLLQGASEETATIRTAGIEESSERQAVVVICFIRYCTKFYRILAQF
ncbi:hypothetical protein OESDEN_03521 [Oesophagostomum dentatum]|uniref:Uncharacterized protein n=1 Tax=Oesophagostomum dentatum TaxID=61180 RepID=A0A0B1TM78_OESDE|nr:hypothetical protein OESDEN_03521 [Oesophagostomum dentatum]